MSPGSTKIIECPHCRKVARSESLASGNTLGATLWSDGKLVAPMMPRFPRITKCWSCAGFYWVEDAKVLAEINFPNWLPEHIQEMDIPQEWKDCHKENSTVFEVEKLSLSDLNNAIHKGLGHNRDREFYLRTELWQTLNDSIRDRDNAEFSDKDEELFRSNLKRMLKILPPPKALDDRDPDFTKAAIMIQVGRSKEAIRILKSIDTDDPSGGFKDLVERLMKIAQSGERKVQKIYADTETSVAKSDSQSD